MRNSGSYRLIKKKISVIRETARHRRFVKYGGAPNSKGRSIWRDRVTAWKELGRPITTHTQSIDEWDEENMPPDPALRAAFSGIEPFYRRYGFPGGNDLVLRTMLGRPPRRMKAYIGELAANTLGA